MMDLMDPASRAMDEVGRAVAAAAGEPQITHVSPVEIEAIARSAGWPRVRCVDPSSFARWFDGRSDGLTPVSYEWLLFAEL